MDTSPIIEIHDLTNNLGGQTIHSGLNLSIPPKQILGLVGGSGSGKTTLLRSILMLLQPTSGSIKVFGQEVTHCSLEQARAVQSRWGVLFQQNALFSSLTVLENVQFPLRTFTHLPSSAQEQIALLKIMMAGLSENAARKYPAELSGGMQKRVALARAIALDPKLLFFDEPTAGLDPRSAEELDKLILKLRDSLDLTVVIITHDQASLARVTDKVAFLGDGKVLAVAPLSELKSDPHPLIQDYFSGYEGKK